MLFEFKLNCVFEVTYLILNGLETTSFAFRIVKSNPS